MLSLEIQKAQAKNAFFHEFITLVSIIVVPLLLLGCAWLTQNPYFGIVGYLIVFLLLWITGSLFGFSVFSGVGISVYIFLMFVGPVLNEMYMESVGVKKHAIVVDIQHYRVMDPHDPHGLENTDWDCKLETTDGKPIRFKLENENGCWGNLKVGQKIEIVEDPSGWWGPMTSSKLYRSPTWGMWVSTGIGLLIQVWILYRLRPRR
jgi:hypothetical protein